MRPAQTPNCHRDYLTTMYERFTAVPDGDGHFHAPDGRRAFPVQCPMCGHNFHSAESWAMKAGINTGWATCLCGTFLHLELTPDRAVMTAQNWDTWAAQFKARRAL